MGVRCCMRRGVRAFLVFKRDVILSSRLLLEIGRCCGPEAAHGIQFIFVNIMG